MLVYRQKSSSHQPTNPNFMNQVETIYVFRELRPKNKRILDYFRSNNWILHYVSASSISALPSNNEMEEISKASGFNIAFLPGIKGGIHGGSNREPIDLMSLRERNAHCTIFFVDKDSPIHFGTHTIEMGKSRASQIQIEGASVLSVEHVSKLSGLRKLGLLSSVVSKEAKSPDYTSSRRYALSLAS